MKISREQYNNIWITSDYHYDHGNVLKYCDRPFDSVQEMNQNIIHNHNIYVGKNDLWIHLGDLCFGTIELPRPEGRGFSGRIN